MSRSENGAPLSDMRGYYYYCSDGTKPVSICTHEQHINPERGEDWSLVCLVPHPPIGVSTTYYNREHTATWCIDHSEGRITTLPSEADGGIGKSLRFNPRSNAVDLVHTGAMRPHKSDKSLHDHHMNSGVHWTFHDNGRICVKPFSSSCIGVYEPTNAHHLKFFRSDHHSTFEPYMYKPFQDIKKHAWKIIP